MNPEIVSSTKFINNTRSPTVSSPKSFYLKTLEFSTKIKIYSPLLIKLVRRPHYEGYIT